MSVNSKMTALADEIRELSGTTTSKSIDAMTSDVDAANAEIAEQTELLEQIATALEGKAGGGSSGEPATCTIEIINETISNPLVPSYLTELWYVAYENGELIGYGGVEGSEYNRMPLNFDWYAETNTLNNVVCGSMICLADAAGMVDAPANWLINAAYDNRFLMVPTTPNSTHTIKLVAW